VMVVSDRKSDEGIPLVIHNIGQGTREENRLFEFELTGHYRLPKSQQPVDGKTPEAPQPPHNIQTNHSPTAGHRWP
jgi:hypothetical protein